MPTHAERIEDQEEQTMREQQRRFQKWAWKWLPILGLEGWDIQVQAFPGEYIVGGELSGAATASTTGNWQYEHGTIFVNALIFAGLHDDMAEETVVHELCHFLLFEVEGTCTVNGPPKAGDSALDYASKHNERTVTRLARAYMRANGMKTSGLHGRSWPGILLKDLMARANGGEELWQNNLSRPPRNPSRNKS